MPRLILGVLCYICDMADLNIRNIDPALMTKLKVGAAQRSLTLRAHCIDLLTGQAATVDAKPVFEIDSPAAKRYVARVLDQQKATIPIEDERIRETTYEPLLD